MQLNIKDVKTIAKNAEQIADVMSVESRNFAVFCHRVVEAVESTEEDFKVITLDGQKAAVVYLAYRARLIALADSLPTSVPEEPEPDPEPEPEPEPEPDPESEPEE